MTRYSEQGDRIVADAERLREQEARDAELDAIARRLGPQHRTDTAPDGSAEFRDLFGHPGQSWTQP